MTPLASRLSPAAALLRAILIISAILVLAGAGVVASLGVIEAAPSPTRAAMFAIGAIFVGLALAAMLLAAASVVGLLARLRSQADGGTVPDVGPTVERLEQSVRMLVGAQSAPRAAGGAGGTLGIPDDAGGGGRPAALLEQIRDLCLMNEEQRQRYARYYWARRKQASVETIERDVLVGDWARAFARLEELQIVLPGDPQLAELRERVESEQAARLEEDIRIARGRIHGNMTAVHWQQAEELAAALQAKYPGKVEADELAEDIRRQHEAWERQNTDRLFRDIAAATEQRHWRQAVLAVEDFIRRYPLDPRSESLRLDLPTLLENAAAHERKEQEELFKDLLKRQRYDEAVNVARGVIGKYPQSPTAMELNKLLPRVEELARAEAVRMAALNTASMVPAATA